MNKTFANSYFLALRRVSFIRILDCLGNEQGSKIARKQEKETRRKKMSCSKEKQSIHQ